jgi:hypothetical protein
MFIRRKSRRENPGTRSRRRPKVTNRPVHFEALESRVLLARVAETIWDFNGDGVPPADNLCNHGYTANVTAAKNVTVPAEAEEITRITFNIYYTSCTSGGSWSLYLNGNQVASAANPDPQYDCSCTPAPAKWPLQVIVDDPAVISALWNSGASNELRVVPNTSGPFYTSYYGATIDYETDIASSLYPHDSDGGSRAGSVLRRIRFVFRCQLDRLVQLGFRRR